jgi:hypothetical protein
MTYHLETMLESSPSHKVWQDKLKSDTEGFTWHFETMYAAISSVMTSMTETLLLFDLRQYPLDSNDSVVLCAKCL